MARGSDIKGTIVAISKRDDFQTSIKVGLACIPVVGSILSTVMGDVQSKWKEDRLLELIDELAARTSRVESRIDSEYVKKEEFYFFFEQAAREYMASSDKIHQSYYVGLVVSSMRQGADENYLEREYYLKKIREYSSIHLDLLRLYYDPEKALALKGYTRYNFPDNGFKGIVTIYLSGVDFSVIRSAHQDLYSAKLINSDSNIFGTVMSSKGIDILAGRVSESGKRMVNMCLPLDLE